MRKPRSNSKTTNNSRSATNAQRSKRVRYGALPQPPEKMVVPYAQSREELKNLTEGQLTEIVMGTQAFKDEIGMVCDKLDSKRGRRGNKRGTDPLYSAWECEAVFVYQRVCGLRSVKEARDRLAGDRGNDARRILGFNKSRETNPDRVRKLRVGVPSESTLSRHRRRFGEKRRRSAYQRLFKRLVKEHLWKAPVSRSTPSESHGFVFAGTVAAMDDASRSEPVGREEGGVGPAPFSSRQRSAKRAGGTIPSAECGCSVL